MKKPTTRSILLASLLAVSIQSGFCQGTVYFMRSEFRAALSSATTITFENLPPTDWNGSGVTSISDSGVTFTTGYLYVTNPGGLWYPIPGSGKYLWHFDGWYPVTVLLPEGVTAFGADFSGGIEPNPLFNATLTVNLAGGPSYAYSFSGPRGSWTFFGVTFAQPIASVVYDDGGSFLHEEMLDNVTFGSVIPEPSALGLFALGGSFLGWRLRRMKDG
jgi:hypothetical protein